MFRALCRAAVWLAVPLLAAMGFGVYWYIRPPGGTPVTPSATVEADDQADLELPEAEREFLWQVEHHGNLLSRHGFAKIADALKRADAASLTAIFASTFAGKDLHHPQEARLDSDIVHVVRHSDGGEATPLTREQFVARLLNYRRVFAQPPSVKLSLMGLLPADRADMQGTWRGSCQLRLWGEHAAGKPAEVVIYLQYETKQPSTANLEQGGWLTACGITQAQVGRAERYLMRECAAERGIDPAQFHDNWKPGAEPGTVTGGVYLCDFDHDGWLDVLITDFSGNYLYRGLPGGKFEYVNTKVGLPAAFPNGEGTAVVAAFVDLDGDGWEDLILGNSIYRNEEGKRFVNVTSRCNLRLPKYVTGIAIADFDRDGKMDLYLTRVGQGKASSWLSGKSGLQSGNRLWRNKGNWQFEDVTETSGTDGGSRSTFTAVWLDANDDGWPDLFVPNEFGNGILYINNGDGTFHGQELADHPCDFGTMGVTVGDVDNDGHIDIYCANMYSKAGSRVIGNLRPDAYPANIVAKMRTFVAGSQLHRNLGVRGQESGVRGQGSGVSKDGGTLTPDSWPLTPGFEQKGKQWQVNDAGWAYGAALVDLDNDGWLDLHATAGYISKSRSEPDG